MRAYSKAASMVDSMAVRWVALMVASMAVPTVDSMVVRWVALMGASMDEM